ncbi:MAG: hypothetical protein SFT81_07145 [Candidatus Caenarcaniphilales bacterium]|nr:hypothetical protein [Candidatus Caenarcaniphilales bacterium]
MTIGQVAPTRPGSVDPTNRVPTTSNNGLTNTQAQSPTDSFTPSEATPTQGSNPTNQSGTNVEGIDGWLSIRDNTLFYNSTNDAFKQAIENGQQEALGQVVQDVMLEALRSPTGLRLNVNGADQGQTLATGENAGGKSLTAAENSLRAQGSITNIMSAIINQVEQYISTDTDKSPGAEERNQALLNSLRETLNRVQASEQAIKGASDAASKELQELGQKANGGGGNPGGQQAP